MSTKIRILLLTAFVYAIMVGSALAGGDIWAGAIIR